MTKHRMDHNKLAVRYDEASAKGARGRFDRKALLDQADEDVIIEGAQVWTNKRSDELVDVRVLPSIHGIMGNLYQTIDAESRRLCRIATTGTGLDKGDSLHLGQLTRSLVQLAGLEHGLAEVDALESLTDEELQAHAGPALEKFLESKGITMEDFVKGLSESKDG